MKITNVKVDLCSWETEPWKTGVGAAFGGDVQLGVVTVETDAGVSGNAFLGSSMVGAEHSARALMEFVKPHLVGENPQDIGRLVVAHVEAEPVGVDRRDRRRRRVPVGHQRQGRRPADPPPARHLQGLGAGLLQHRLPRHAEEYVEEALRFQEMGWTAHKLHPHGEPLADVVICAAVRDAVGEEMVLMLDSMWAYQYADALRVGRAIEELDYYWYEDPLVEEDVYHYVKLGQKLDIPIMSTEFAPGRFYGMAAWITRYATDILRGDVAVTGGITPLVRQCHLAEGFNMRCEIHHGGNSLNNVANLHVTMAVPNCEYYEFFPCTGANKYGLVEDIAVDAQGRVHAPEQPGLGYEIDWELLNRKRTATVE